MNIIFLTLFDLNSYREHNIYCDFLRVLIKHGHEVYCISPAEKRMSIKTHFEENQHLLKLKIGNTQKTNIVEKGISTMMIEPQFVSAIKKYFSNVKFDLVLYSTPPITLANAVDYIKKRDHAITYLMLKDIFPQNAVDLKMMNTNGIKGIIYKHFRKKEKQLYAISDHIGCMSPANAKYVIKNNPEISVEKVEIFPNCIDLQDMQLTEQERKDMRNKYGIPQDKKVFVYGGNLGKPQGIQFIIECLKRLETKNNAFFLIVGDGTEYEKMEAYINKEKPKNVKLLKRLLKDDYDRMISACDVGMIFLDHRFTIPNFPSRLLSYMQASLPVFACTDVNTDIGKVILKGGFGWWCESNNIKAFQETIELICTCDLNTMGELGYKYLKNNYSVDKSYEIIMKHFAQKE